MPSRTFEKTPSVYAENIQYTITDSTNGFVDTGKTQDKVVPFAYFCPFATNVSVRFSNIAASSGGNIRFQLINAVTGEVIKSGSYYVLIYWLNR